MCKHDPHLVGNHGIARFNRVLVLADESEEIDPQLADSRTLATMLLVREMLIQGAHLDEVSVNAIVLSEILDPRTRMLINLANISNYVMSNDLISSALTQVSENRHMNRVISELLTSEGNEVYLKSARDYSFEHEEISFWQIMARARRLSHIVIGYKLHSDSMHTLNPGDKDKKQQWRTDDLIIVICED